MRIYKIVLLFIIAMQSYCFAQKEIIKPLKIGDKLPDLMITKVLGTSLTSIKFSDYRNKVIVIDFWATTCGPCINELPRLYQLENKFRKDVFIFPISRQKKEVIENAFRIMPSLKNIKLFTAYEDEVLYKLFPHTTIPHDIVIDKNGIVVAITSSQFITEKYIANWINGEKVDAYEKFSDIRIKDYEKPLFLDTLTSKQVITYGFLAKSINGISSKTSRRGSTEQHGDTRLYGTNMDLLGLYHVALRNGKYYPNLRKRRTKINVKDSSLFEKNPGSKFPEKLKDYEENKLFCYDFSVPPNTKLNVYGLFKSFLDNYFNLESKLEMQMVDCYVIKNLDSKKYQTRNGERFIDQAKDHWSFGNWSIADISFRLDERSDIPILSEIDPKVLVDLSFFPYLNDFKLLKIELNKNGLDLVNESREMEIIVIEDKK